MDRTEICYLSASQLSGLIQRKEVSPVEVVEAHLARIEATEPTLNSFISLLPQQALAAAKTAEEEIQAGNHRGPLHGIPITLKDLYYVKGVRNTSGSKIFHDFVPDYDSTLVSKLKHAGIIILGKANTHQFAYGITGENPDYGDMHNPWDTARVAGGSSGGSGSATAAGQCTITMGSDTGGSVRIPSALCGIVGLKPTYGRLSRYGLNSLCWTLDHAGPMVRSVEDAALVLNAIAGYDANDPASANVPVPDFTRALTGNIKGVRVGVPKEYFQVPLDPQVEQGVRKAIEVLGELGATVTEVSWPMFHYSFAISTVPLMAEASANLADLVRSRGDDFYPPTRLRVEAGLFLSATEYLRAMRARTLFNRSSLELLQQVDVLVGPMEPIPAPKLGEGQVQVGNTTQGVIPTLTQFNRAFNLNGFPAITVPCGFSDNNLPIGLQIAGRPYDESSVLRVAHAYEQATEWHKRRPPI